MTVEDTDTTLEQITELRVNAVAPGPIWTPFWTKPGGFAETLGKFHSLPPLEAVEHEMKLRQLRLARLGRPEQVANVIVFLASDLASFVTSSVWGVDGGSVRSITYRQSGSHLSFIFFHLSIDGSFHWPPRECFNNTGRRWARETARLSALLPTSRIAPANEAPPLRRGILGSGWIAERFIESVRAPRLQPSAGSASKPYGL
jgi:hypothetical protein